MLEQWLNRETPAVPAVGTPRRLPLRFQRERDSLTSRFPLGLMSACRSARVSAARARSTSLHVRLERLQGGFASAYRSPRS